METAAALTEAFLAAPFEPAGWDLALKQLARSTRSSRTQLLAVGGPEAIPLNWTTDAPDRFIENFVEIGGGSPSRNWRVASSGGVLDIVHEAHYDRVRQDMRADIYDDYVSHYDMPFGCQTVLMQAPGTFIGLATLRSATDRRTSTADRKVFTHAAPQALAAIRMQQAIEHQGMAMVAGALEAMQAIAFIFDSHGRVGGLTTNAEAWLGSRRSVQLAGGRLCAVRPGEARALDRCLAAVLKDDATAGPQRLWLGGDARREYCELFPLPRRDWSFGFAPRAIMVVRAAREIDADRAELLEPLLDLTAAEAQVAIGLARGQSRQDIASARGVSVGTVNAQLKTIFRKSDVHREAELIALLCRLL